MQRHIGCEVHGQRRMDVSCPPLRNQQEGRVAEGAVDRPQPTLGRSAPSTLHNLASPLNFKPGCLARIPRRLHLRCDRTVAREPSAHGEKRRSGRDGGSVVGKVQYDPIELLRDGRDVRQRLLELAIDVVVVGKLRPAVGRSPQIGKTYRCVLRPRLNGHVQTRTAEAPSHVLRQARAAESRLEDSVSCADA